MPYIVILIILCVIVGGLYRSRSMHVSLGKPVSEKSVFTISSEQRYRSLSEQQPIKLGIRSEFAITDQKTQQTYQFAIDRNFRIYPILNTTDASVSYTVSRPRYLLDHYVDVGAWVAYQPQFSRSVDLGIRLSPGRYIFGYASPDVLIGSQSCGFGISLYMPAYHVGTSIGRFGAGAGYFISYDDMTQHSLGWYVSVSTYF